MTIQFTDVDDYTNKKLLGGTPEQRCEFKTKDGIRITANIFSSFTPIRDKDYVIGLNFYYHTNTYYYYIDRIVGIDPSAEDLSKIDKKAIDIAQDIVVELSKCDSPKEFDDILNNYGEISILVSGD